MKAAVYTNYGPPEIVKVTDIPEAVPKENELLVKVYASTVNRTDCGFRSAEYFIVRFFSGLFRPKNKVLGNEFAGQVVGSGSKVTQFKLNDRVFGYNDKNFGGHAEYMIIRENQAVASMPENLSYLEAAPICEGAHYALADLRAAKIQAGDHILINGATGAIGSSAVQLAKYFGAHVTAVCDTPNVDLVKQLGADLVIDYCKEDFTQCGKTFRIVFDAVGKSSFGRCKPLMTQKGIYMSTELGPGSQNPFLALITPLLGGKRVLFPIPPTQVEDVIFLKELVEKGKFKPVIDREYPLSEIVEAYRYVETGRKIGNVVLRICDQ